MDRRRGAVLGPIGDDAAAADVRPPRRNGAGVAPRADRPGARRKSVLAPVPASQGAAVGASAPRGVGESMKQALAMSAAANARRKSTAAPPPAAAAGTLDAAAESATAGAAGQAAAAASAYNVAGVVAQMDISGGLGARSRRAQLTLEETSAPQRQARKVRRWRPPKGGPKKDESAVHPILRRPATAAELQKLSHALWGEADGLGSAGDEDEEESDDDSALDELTELELQVRHGGAGRGVYAGGTGSAADRLYSQALMSLAMHERRKHGGMSLESKMEMHDEFLQARRRHETASSDSPSSKPRSAQASSASPHAAAVAAAALRATTSTKGAAAALKVTISEEDPASRGKGADGGGGAGPAAAAGAQPRAVSPSPGSGPDLGGGASDSLAASPLQLPAPTSPAAHPGARAGGQTSGLAPPPPVHTLGPAPDAQTIRSPKTALASVSSSHAVGPTAPQPALPGGGGRGAAGGGTHAPVGTGSALPQLLLSGRGRSGEGRAVGFVSKPPRAGGELEHLHPGVSAAASSCSSSHLFGPPPAAQEQQQQSPHELPPASSAAALRAIDVISGGRANPAAQAAAAYATGEFDLSLKYVASALERADGESAVLHRLKGRAHRQVAEHDMAAREAMRAIDLEPSNIDGYLQCSKALGRLGRRPAAGASLLEALRIDPFDDTVAERYEHLLSSIRRAREFAQPARPLTLPPSASSPRRRRRRRRGGDEGAGASARSEAEREGEGESEGEEEEEERTPGGVAHGASGGAPRWQPVPTAKSADRRIFDERREWALPSSAAAADADDGGGGGGGAAVGDWRGAARGPASADAADGPVPPAPIVQVVAVGKHTISIKWQPGQPELSARRSAAGSPGRSSRRSLGSDDEAAAAEEEEAQLAVTFELWAAAAVCEWDSTRQSLVFGRGAWRAVPLESDDAEEATIDGLQPGTAYILCVSGANGAGAPGPPAELQLTTLGEEIRLIEHVDVPPSWRRLRIDDVLNPGASAAAAASAPRGPGLSGKLKRTGGGALDLRAVVQETTQQAKGAEKVRGHLVRVTWQHRQLLVCAFRHACLLAGERADERARELREAERTRTRLRKQYDLQPRKLVIVLAPGPNIEAVKSLLIAARLHIEGACELVAVVCNGGGTKAVATQRAILAKALLNSQRLYDVPVGIGEPSGKPYTAPAHEYSFPGFAKVHVDELRDGQEVLRDVLVHAQPRSLTFVILSALSDVAALLRAGLGNLLFSKVALVTTMGGCVLHWGEAEGEGAAPRMRGHDRPEAITPDNAANNQLDLDAARVVYSWCLEKHIPLRVIGREAICDVPMRIFKQMAEAHPHDPVMKYIRTGQEQGLIGLWKRVCRGEIPNCDKKWFFVKFCGVVEAEFERRGFDKLSESFQIERRLDGTIKPYDAVALLLAMSSEESARVFAFRAAKQAPSIFIFSDVVHMVPSAPVVEVFQQTLVAVARSRTAGWARYRPQSADATRPPIAMGASLHAFTQLCLSCQIVHPPAVTQLTVEKAFLETVRQRTLAKPGSAEGGGADDGEGVVAAEELLSIPDFIGALIRVAAHKHAQRGGGGRSANLTLADAFEQMLITLLGPNLPLHAKAEDPFLHATLTPAARAILSRWGAELRLVFGGYSSAGKSAFAVSRQPVSHIRAVDLLVIARDGGLVGGAPGQLSAQHVLTLFTQTRADQEPVNDLDDMVAFELTYHEYAEFVARLCELHTSGPPKPRPGKPLGRQAGTTSVLERYTATLAGLGQDAHEGGAPVEPDPADEDAPLAALKRFRAGMAAKKSASASSAVPSGPAPDGRPFEVRLDEWLQRVFLAAVLPALQRRMEEHALQEFSMRAAQVVVDETPAGSFRQHQRTPASSFKQRSKGKATSSR